MKLLNTTLLVLFTTMSFSNMTYAATAEISWLEPDKYRDINPGEQGRKKFRENVFHNFEKHFAKLANKLPEEQMLKVTVTDVDLAGDTHAEGISRMRIVKDIYFPRLNFSYQLLDANGAEIIADTVVLKDMNFMMGAHLKYRNEALRYEKQMLDDWFSKTFENNLAPQAK